MAFMDKLGQAANKVGSVAGDTLDYGKAKGKIIAERGKIKDAKEAIGECVYAAVKAGEEIDMDKVKEYCEEITQAEAKQSGQDISGAFKKKDAE